MLERAAVLLLSVTVLAGCVGDDGPTRSEALLLASPYPSLLVEIDYVTGREPSPAALLALEKALQDLTAKTQVVIAEPTMIPVQSEDPEERDLERIHQRYATLMDVGKGEFGQGEMAYLHIVYMNGRFQGSSSTAHSAGSTLRSHSAIFIFPDAFSHAFRIVGSEKQSMDTEVEASVMLHELGHAFGLVGRGVPENRPHTDGSGHSTNPNSVMTKQLALASGGLVTSSIPRDFDADDKADLAAFVERHS